MKEEKLKKNILLKDYPHFDKIIINTILNNSQDNLYYKDKKSRYILVSKSQALRLGFDDPDSVTGKTDFDFFLKDSAEESFRTELKIMKSKVPVIDQTEKECWIDGRITWILSSKYPLFDLNGNIIGTWGSSKDITELKQKEHELKKVNKKLEINSLQDTLTGLFNKRFFYEELQKEFDLGIRQRERGNSFNFSVIIFDIDYFKTINDNFGYQTGDTAIKHIASIIEQSVRSTDKAFRYGGDEFLILLPNTNLDDARFVAEKIKNTIINTPFISNKTFKLSISGGVASFDESMNEEDILEKADRRLYISKNTGKNKIF